MHIYEMRNFIDAVRLCMVFYVASHMIRRVESSFLLPWSDLSGMFSFVLVPGFLPAGLSIIKNIIILFWKPKEVLKYKPSNNDTLYFFLDELNSKH